METQTIWIISIIGYVVTGLFLGAMWFDHKDPDQNVREFEAAMKGLFWPIYLIVLAGRKLNRTFPTN